MAQNATVLLKFDVPEISHLAEDERQRILTECWNSAAVQEEFRLFWDRPQRIPFIPLFIVVPLCLLAHMSLGVTLSIALPVTFIGFFFVKRHYQRRLVSLIRRTAADELLRVPMVAPAGPGR